MCVCVCVCVCVCEQVELCIVKLDRAEQLINGLGGEKDRWTEAAHALRTQFHGLTGDVLVRVQLV